jgi:coenzyme F420 biosynthesis associated uncharacterized protein
MIDWFVAERIAWLVAGSGTASAPRADLGALAGESERRVIAYTGLVPAAPLPAPEGIGRREWVASNIRSMRRLIDPVLGRAREELGPMRPAIQIGLGFAMSAEIGVLVGYMAQRVLGQYELVLLDEPSDPAPPRLLFVMPNLGNAVRALGADDHEFMTWVTLHEVTHAVQFGAVPWLRGYLASLVDELLRSAEARLEAPRRLRLPSGDQLARLTRSLGRGDLVSIIANPAERHTLDRVQAVMSVIEGHAEHVMDAVAPELLPSLPDMRRAMDERRTVQSPLGRLMSRLLGLEMKLKQYERGKIFCDEVARVAGPAGLSHLFSSPEALPTLAEIEDPAAWLRR